MQANNVGKERVSLFKTAMNGTKNNATIQKTMKGFGTLPPAFLHFENASFLRDVISSPLTHILLLIAASVVEFRSRQRKSFMRRPHSIIVFTQNALDFREHFVLSERFKEYICT